MSEVTDLVVIEKSNAMEVFKSADQIEDILQKVEREVMSFVPDVTTAKGRKEIASLAYKVAQTKTYLDGLGKDLVAELKEIPKLIDANRKTVRDRLDELKEKARQPLTNYEDEQERIKKEEEEKRAAEELAKNIEADHEMALLMNDAFDRDLAEKKAEEQRQRIAHEEEIKRQAEEKAKREAEEKAAAEIAAAKKREEDAIAAKAQAELLAKQEKEKAEREAKEALDRAEREKQEAIEAERKKAQEEADRIRREAEAKEAARLAEEKRIKDEEERRAKDKAHRKEVNNKILSDMLKAGASEEVAKNIITAIVKGEVFATRITY
ncbi:cell envelope biogenesis protein TolA [Salmonella enterica subsp. enterica serovar Tennessee]|nr:cell envelope biogenesis protein TolA [Salmonella enterica]EBK2615318.1 cell envelope biogenesis protein TolA [Salmonella enterica subsp. enterica serovar Tennessee]EBA2921002.1 cell envelope biogenesis protein TolA [Salmonella enterica]EBS0091021.1 cell envelope biogenesis protein TolA [Salmonella enterica subsp. enterica serovar Tennessee]EBX0298741.1 cell envelope biogenesis protein TolA [Salmonella enterica subsp. enterica serovar Tennessee]